MPAIKWSLIIIGMVLGVFTPWQYQAVAMMALLMGYAGCYELKWNRFQIILESLFGGLATGLGLQFLIAYGVMNQIIPMIIAPLLVWLVLRIIFYAVETKYTLHPNLVLADIRAEEDNPDYYGTSAWASDNTGKASLPDAQGRYLCYEFFHGGGEIAMGGPTYGEVIFNNQCAFTGVGPSIAISEDGEYAAMTQPSRGEWGLLIVNLHQKRVFQSKANRFWELDRIEAGVIFGRESPLTSNTKYSLSIAKALETAIELPMVEDDGWWVLDYPGREPFTHYQVITIESKRGGHRISFVPDIKPFKSNPFLRSQHPEYAVLVDDQLLEFELSVRNPAAVWVDGQIHESVCDGRFLVVANKIIDFKDSVNNTFSIKNCTVLPFHQGCDENTYAHFEYGKKADVGDSHLSAYGTVLPRSTGWTDAEFIVSGNTSPWDEESVVYWDIDSQKQTQERKAIVRQLNYKIDLQKLSYVKKLKLCTQIHLINRGNVKHTASLVYQGEENTNGGYSSYRLITSYGAVIENVIHEAIWSCCGRYLAVVQFEHPPGIPKCISIIDFETGNIKKIDGIYALPSLIWFDKSMLQFTHIVGILETTEYGSSDPRETYRHEEIVRITEPANINNEYALLIERKLNLAINTKKKRTAKAVKPEKSLPTSMAMLAQHCILFAPDFDTPVLQQPKTGI